MKEEYIYINRKRIGLMLQEERIRQGWSQQQLAMMCGITATNISRIEQGKYNVSLDTAACICNALNVRLIISNNV